MILISLIKLNIVPIDVPTQRLMITRAYSGIRLKDIIRQIYIESGGDIRGFYKGYLITLSISLPFNSIAWTLLENSIKS
ncbi:unnamed protein product [Rotaria sp. Silwood2]|nr:unnamed protein product [Rotaria sp. Silwood2]CAF3032847.1 unnamed protein product [Rotaria sp. Silwood2]CAF3533312.1 unnamed protein product [Rotaria sp. Silwood2]